MTFVTTLQLGGGGGGGGGGFFTVTCKVSGDNLMGVPSDFGNDCRLDLSEVRCKCPK